jgi:RHS repeat-associated protein
MMPASKHGDPQLGVDIHLCVVPPSPSPVPLPTPHMSVVFDPFDYIPIIGATVSVCGMKRATAGTSGIAVHIPPGFPFAPMLPQKDDELFMGSATVVADGDPFSYIALPVLSCQVAGMPSIPRPRKKGPKKMMLGPLVFNLAIPTNVFVGGPPTISLMGMAMKGAFAGLGKLAKSGVFKRMRQKLFKNMKPGFLKCTIMRAEPVNILSGAVSVEHQDFVLPGRLPIEWRRVYGSDNVHTGHCGHGWETPADGRLEITHEGVLMHYPGLGPLYFNGLPVAEGETAAELELQDGAVLTDVDGEYRVRTKEDRIYHFSKGWLRRLPDGSSTIALGKIADLCGNWLKLERQSGMLMAIEESAGRRLEFRTEQGRIREVSLGVPESTERHVYVRYEYDEQGDLTCVRDALGQPYSFGYDAHRMVRHTDRNGLSFYYEYATANGDWRVIHAWGDGGLYDYRFEYTDVLRERRITDSLGHVATVKLNEQDLPINEIDALGGVTIYEYDGAGRTVGVTDQDGHRTGYEYDERGNLTKVLYADGAAVQTQFSAANKVVCNIDAAGGAWTQHWDERGLLVAQQSPLGHASRFEYDARGQLTACLNPRGIRAELTFDVYGNLVKLRRGSGKPLRLAYDMRGNIVGKLDELSQKTLYRHDAKNRLIGVLSPGGQVSCEYDAEDNLTCYVDADGSQTQLRYFGQGELCERILPDGRKVEYRYDTEEQLIEVREQEHAVYRFSRDALGRVIQETDAFGQVTQYAYSPGGHPRLSTDPLSRRVDYVTDPLGRVLKRIMPDAAGANGCSEDSFEYDPRGYLLAFENQHVRVERSFDAEGRLLQEQQGELFTIQNTYDGRGNRTRRLTTLQGSGPTTTHRILYSYDAADQPSQVQIDDEAPIRVERDAVGRIVAQQLSSEVRSERDFGEDGRVSRQRVHVAGRDIVDVRFRHDAAGNLVERTDAALGVDRFVLDPMGRVTQHLDPENRITQYLAGGSEQRLGTGSSWQPDAAGTAEIDWVRESVSSSVQYRFDRSGNVIRRIDHRGALRLQWDAAHRLIEAHRDGVTTLYKYDALGRRIEKCTGAKRVRFAWDADALVADVGDADDATGTAREWVYMPASFEPLAVICSRPESPRVLHYHNDPNGAPIRLTDSAGKVWWAAAYTAHGGIARLSVNDFDQPLRLQGQYEDAESSLHYNRHRYFDPISGAFVSSDPLGVIAGEDPYRYAPNTFAWADPLGLTCSATLAQAVDLNRGSRSFRLEQGTAASGWKHIFDRHVDPTRFPNKSKFDGLSQDEIVGLLGKTVKHGKETVYDGLPVFEKRLKINGQWKKYRATVNADGTVRTFHPLD